MRTLRRIAATFRRWLSRDRAERELHEDVQSFVNLRADELRAEGLPDDEARRRACIELGGVAQVEEAVRQRRTGALVEQTLQDVRYALRGLRRTPGFTITAVLTLGLGIGVTTAVFAVLNASVLRPLPYRSPEQLVELGHTFHADTADASTGFGVTWKEVAFWRAQAQLFSAVEARDLTLPPRSWAETGRVVRLGRFTAGLPSLLGVSPFIGRTFTPAENAAGAPVIVLSEALWRGAFARASDVIGRTMTIDRKMFTVIGVMPETFRYGPPGDGRMDGWTTLPERGTSSTPDNDMTIVVCRLRPGLALEQAAAIARTVAPAIQKELSPPPPCDQPWSPRLLTLDAWRMKTARADTLSPLLMLLATSGAVLLIACANVANLFSARGLARRGELAMRAALGASRRRLVRLLVVEGAVVAALAAAAGVFIAMVSLSAGQSVMPSLLATELFEVGPPSLDWRLCAFGAAATCVVTMLSSLWPAVSCSRALSAQGAAGRTVGPANRRRWSRIVVQAAQVAIALVLVVGAGLAARSVAATLTTDLGFESKRLAVFSADLPVDRYPSPESQRVMTETLLQTVRRVRGVDGAALGMDPTAVSSSYYFEEEGHAPIRQVKVSIRNRVGHGYFETAGLRLIAGREFSDANGVGAPKVVIVDDAAARRLFGDRPAVGSRIRLDPNTEFMTVIGVVSNAVTTDFTRKGRALGFYRPESQLTPSRFVRMVIRAHASAGDVVTDVRAAALTVEPNLRDATIEPVALAFDRAETFRQPQFLASIVVIFATLALVTAAVGLFGVLSYTVAQRRREIGVRVALGSTMAQIRQLVVMEALRPVIAGIAIGWVVAWLLAQYVGSFLYGVSARDPMTFATSGAVLLLAALIAAIGPIRRATGVDPIRALRAE